MTPHWNHVAPCTFPTTGSCTCGANLPLPDYDIVYDQSGDPVSVECPCGWGRVVLFDETPPEAFEAHKATAIHALNS